MNRQYLCETTLSGLRPLGVGGRRVQESWHEIESAIRTGLGDSCARLFAEPILSEGGISWFAEVEGEACPYAVLPSGEQARLLADVETRLQQLKERVEQLKRSGSPAERRLGETLERVLSVPSPASGNAFLYAVRVPATEHGASAFTTEPVLVNWGTRDDVPEPPLGVLEDFLRGEALRLHPAPADAPPDLQSPSTPDTAPLLPEEEEALPAAPVAAITLQPLAAGPLTLSWTLPLWLLFALLVASIVYLLLAACGVGGVVFGSRSFCAAPGGGLGTAQARGAELERTLHDLETRLASLPHCETPVIRDPAAAEHSIEQLDQQVAEAGGRVGDLTFTLGWEGDADLDLHVFCPNGLLIDWQHRLQPGCGDGQLDIDANVISIRSHPVENISWPGAPLPGHYRIAVRNAQGRSTGNQSVPFQLRVKIGSADQLIEGAVRPGVAVLARELDVE